MLARLLKLDTINSLGLHTTQNSREQRRIRQSNHLLYSILLNYPFYFILYLAFSYNWLAAALIPLGALTAFGLFMNASGRTISGRIILLAVNNLSVLIMSAALGAEAGLHFVFFLIIVFPVIVFGIRQKIIISISILISFLGFIYFDNFPDQIQPMVTLNPVLTRILRFAFITTTLFGLVWALAYLSIYNARYEDALLQLKEKQDGDYYLTHLISKPLLTNLNRSDIVKTSFLIRQKKDFHFRNWKATVGGDICVTGNVKLWNRPHTFFMNADAMGKSMQGAGGAIVIGTVIRARLVQSERLAFELSPRKWLTTIFEDLSDIFLAFEGSMMASATVGLIDDYSGLMYYFCAEHPHMILIRDGVPQILESPAQLFKIGSPLQVGPVINELQLIPGDKLLIGSDGKDDLLLQKENQQSAMNDDEMLFVEIVKRNGTNLRKLYRAIRNTGEVIDDLSLLRVVFAGPKNGLEVRESDKELFDKVAFLVQCQDYLGALTVMGSNSRENTGLQLLYWRAYCLERLGRAAEAVPILERALKMNKSDKNCVELLDSILKRSGYQIPHSTEILAELKAGAEYHAPEPAGVSKLTFF